MRSMDVPARGPGSGGEPDGQARPPSELLDNLRLRLSQLAENHPSAAPQLAETGRGPAESPPRPSDGPDPAPERGELTGPDAVPEQDEPAGPAAAADGEAGAGEQPAGAGEQAAGAGEDGRSGPDGTPGGGLGDDLLAGSGAAGALGGRDLPGLRGTAEAYRPWFMSDEPGSPWWAAGQDL